MRYLLLFMCYCMLSSAGAQIHQPHQRFLETGGGLVEGVQLKKADNTGYWLKASLGKYGKKEGVYQVGLMAQRKYYQPAEELIAVNLYFVEGTFAPTAFTSADRKFYLSPVMGVLMGYEENHSMAAYSADSAAIKPNKFLVGFTGGLSGEWNMSSRMAIILFARTHYLPTSAIEQFHFQYGIGLRFNYFKP